VRRPGLTAKERDQALDELARVRGFLNDLVLVFPSVAREGAVYVEAGPSREAGYDVSCGGAGYFVPGELGVVKEFDVSRAAKLLRKRAANERADAFDAIYQGCLDGLRGTTTREAEAEASCAHREKTKACSL